MICECEKLNKGPFKTEESYLVFQKKVNQLIDASILKKIGKIEDLFLTYEYCCLVCDKIWVLKIPDQAYRGGWFEKQ